MSVAAYAPPTGDGTGAPRRTAHARTRAGRVIGLLVLGGALVLVFLFGIWIGARDIPFTAAWNVLWHNDGSRDAVIIHDYRIPRALLGLMVGAGLGLAGAVMQALTRNALADPGLLGVSMGASAGVVVAIAFLGITTVMGYVWFGILGAAVASVLVYLIGSAGRGLPNPDRLVLAGAAVFAVVHAFIGAVLLLNPQAFDEFRFWNVGSLAGRGMGVVAQVAPFIVAGTVLALLLARPLNALALGEQVGRALGAHLGRTRVYGALAVTLLCGAATAAVGPIGFVGLAVPRAARLIVGPDQRWVLPYSALLAAILLLGSDILGRVVGAPGELEVGIVTAFLGAPVFVALCRRRKPAGL